MKTIYWIAGLASLPLLLFWAEFAASQIDKKPVAVPVRESISGLNVFPLIIHLNGPLATRPRNR